MGEAVEEASTTKYMSPHNDGDDVKGRRQGNGRGESADGFCPKGHPTRLFPARAAVKSTLYTVLCSYLLSRLPTNSANLLLS